MTLPSELHSAIVDALATPTHPQAYGWDPITKRALTHLCLTSRILRHFASSHLYSSIIISTAPQLHSLVHSLRTPDEPLSKRVYALSLRDFDDALEDGNADALIELLRLLQHHTTFRRLIIDRGLRSWVDDINDSSDEEDAPTLGAVETVISRQRGRFRAALEALPNLQELNSIQDEVYLAARRRDDSWKRNSGWTPHRHLLRLTLYNPIVDMRLVEALANHPTLRHIVVVRTGIDTDTITESFQGLLPGVRFVFVTFVDACRNWQFPILKAAAASLAPGRDIVYVRAPVGNRNRKNNSILRRTQLWVRERLEKGEMYEVEGLSLSTKK